MSELLDYRGREEAIRVLSRYLTPDQMRSAVDRSIEKLVAAAERRQGIYSSRVADEHLAAFIVDVIGIDLLANRRIRRELFQSASDAQLNQLLSSEEVRRLPDRNAYVRRLMSKHWRYGGNFAYNVVQVFGLPPVFAGLPGIPSGPPIEEIEPHKSLPELHDFQSDLYESIINILEGNSEPKRALLSLPTGAGKTRTAVEAIVDWWNNSTSVKPLIMWIAQSDELCDQALEAFREIWIDRGSSGVRKTMRLYRVWGRHRAIPGMYASGVIVASIQKLYEIIRQGNEFELSDLSNDLAIVIVDEAHHAIGKSYTAVLRAINVLVPRFSTEPSVPLLGLSATPYRGFNVEENARLVKRFRNLLVSERLGEDPVSFLRKQGVLASIEHHPIKTGRSYELSDKEVRHVEQLKSLPRSFVKKIGEDPERNHLLTKTILDFPDDWPVLFFGCSVEHATAIAIMLRRKGRSAAVVTAQTRRSTRRSMIEAFRAGELQVLCNYGVLTTGFDAPKINAVVIARPTASVVLYEQMIGRGMRGPLNGGTEKCVVVDMIDNILRYQGQMAYARMMDQWNTFD